MTTSKLKASDITGQFAMIRFESTICENRRTSDDLSVELRGELIKGGTDKIKVHVFDVGAKDKLKGRMEKLRTYLQANCLQFYTTGFLVQRNKVDDILAKCEGIIGEFNGMLMDYYNSYDQLLTEHLNGLHPDLQPVARALSYSRDEWFNRNNIGMLPVMLMQGLTEEDNARLVDEIASASLADIKRTVDTIYKDFFLSNGKLVTSVTTTPLKKLVNLSDKVKQIALGQEGLGNIAGYIRDVQASIIPVGEKNNIIEGHSFSMLLNLIMLLKDEDMLRTCANDARNLPSIDADDDWFKDEPDTEVVIDVARAADELPGNVVTPTVVEPAMDDMFVTADEFDFD